MYLFEFEVSEMMKAAHFMEVPLVFSNTHLTPGMRQPETSQVESQICDAWIAFARTINPNHPGIPEWPVYTIENRVTMIFDVESHVVMDPRREELSAWEGTSLEPMRRKHPVQ